MNASHSSADLSADLAGELRLIVADVLEVGPVNEDDDLISLGADSLSLTALSGRIQARWGVLLTFADLMRHAELSVLVGILSQRLADRAAAGGDRGKAAAVPAAPAFAALPR